jgi:hypothetical protein
VAEERVRVEVAFDGGQTLSVLVSDSSIDELERRLAENAEGTVTLEADDGRYAVAVKRVVFVKRFAREARVGFGAAAPR